MNSAKGIGNLPHARVRAYSRSNMWQEILIGARRKLQTLERFRDCLRIPQLTHTGEVRNLSALKGGIVRMNRYTFTVSLLKPINSNNNALSSFDGTLIRVCRILNLAL